MNLPELITKLLHIERELIEQGIEVNTINVTAINYGTDSDYERYIDEIKVNNNLLILD